MSILFLLFSTLFVSVSLQIDYGETYGLKISSPPSGGTYYSVNKVVARFGEVIELGDVTLILKRFVTLMNISSYDSASTTIIFGNVDPPVLAFFDVESTDKKVYPIPIPLTKLLSFTAYDGVVYCLLEDTLNPGTAVLVGVQISNLAFTQLGEFQNPTSYNFRANAPMTYLANSQTFLTELEGSPVVSIRVMSENSTVLTETPIHGGWQVFWSDIVSHNDSIIGYSEGKIARIKTSGSVKVVRVYRCPGSLAVDFQKEMYYHLSFKNPLCGEKPIIESFTFNNETTRTVPQDYLDGLLSLHSAGAYIPYGCGLTCSTVADCSPYTTCSTCRLGTCVDDGECGSFCLTGKDCYGGVCVGDCEDNQCGRKDCGKTCSTSNDCRFSSTCTTCRLGRCVSEGECGSYCLTDLDCYAGACVGKCFQNKCVQ